jgi:hypothetical protein
VLFLLTDFFISSAPLLVLQGRDVYGQPVAAASGTFVVSFLHENMNHTFSAITHKESGTVESVTIAAGGSSCGAGGTLAAKGGGGSRFAATFNVSGGTIDSVTVTNKGEGYIYAPILEIDSGGDGCAGFTFAPVIKGAGDFVGTAVTTVSGKYQVTPLLIEGSGLNASYFNNVWLHGDPEIKRVDTAIDFDWGNGPITPFAADRASVRWEGMVQIDREIASNPVSGLRAGIRKVEVVLPGYGCTLSGNGEGGGTLLANGGGGSGFAASFTVAGYVRGDGTVATGIKDVIITNPGEEYSSPPALSIATGGTGCAGFRLDAKLSSTRGMDTVFHVETDG